MMKYTCLVLLVIICFGCTSTQKQPVQGVGESQLPYIIDMSELEFSDTPQCLSEFADSISYIRLAEEPLLPDLYSTVHLYVDKAENIYVDENFIYKYTPDGKFVKSLFKIGQGPAEIILKLGCPIYNSDKEYVLVNNYGSESFRKYSLDGDFIDDIPKWNGTDYEQIVACIGDKNIFYYEYRRPKRGDNVNIDGSYLWFTKDCTNDSLVYKMKNSLFHIKAEKGAYFLKTGIYPLYCNHIDSFLCIRHAHQDTLFRTTDALKWEPWYVIKHHKRDADYELLLRLLMGDAFLDDIEGAYQVYDICPLPSGVLFFYKEMDGFIEEGKIGFCKQGEKALTCSSNSFKNDLDDCLKSIKIPLHPHFQRNGYLYVLVNALDFFEEGAKSPFPDLTEDSNPVVVKLKLKGYGRK